MQTTCKLHTEEPQTGIKPTTLSLSETLGMSPARTSTRTTATTKSEQCCSKMQWEKISSQPLLSLLPAAAAAAAAETQKYTSQQSDSSLPLSQQDHKSTEEIWTEDVSPVGGGRLLSTEEQVTLITESMSVTSTDQEKLLLLNKNTELRRVNKELMKLNEDWDQVYRSATLGLQHRLEALELENAAIKRLNSRLLLKVEHQQSAKEYYEQALMQELKKNQELHEYIRLVESRTHHPDRDCTPAKEESFNAVTCNPALGPATNPPACPNLSPSHISGHKPSSSYFPDTSSSGEGQQGKSQRTRTPLGGFGDTQQEMHELKEQLKALQCQTQIYEAEYQTEHNDHKHTLQENRRLRKKREETRQQVALLQEQLKVYEDDFRRERSDKQMLQRLLLKKTPQNKDPVLVHRCNNGQQPPGGDNRTHSGEKRKQHHPLCPKNPNRDKETD